MPPGFHQGPNDTKKAQRQPVFRTPFPALVHLLETSSASFPIQSVHIDWDCLVAKQPTVLETIDSMTAYLLKPEVLRLLDAEKYPKYRLILDLTPSSFVDDSDDFGVILKTLKQRPGRPSKASL